MNAVIGLRVEWTKSKARADRWFEEADMLTEEMRRILWYLKWKAEWWTSRKDLRDVRLDIKEGLEAYSSKQSALLLCMGGQFAAKWYPLLTENELRTEWPQEFLVGLSSAQPADVDPEILLDDHPLIIDDDVFE